MSLFSKLFGDKKSHLPPTVSDVGSVRLKIRSSDLAEFAALEDAPQTSLAAYLQRLATLLEEAVALKFGFFKQNKISAENIQLLSEDVGLLANHAFQHALKVRPEEVSRWLQQLNDLQKPAMIDFSSWDLMARQAPAVLGRVEIPAPTKRLVELVESIRAKHPEWLGAPTPIDHLEEVMERKDPPPRELLSFYRLANSLSAELGSYLLTISPLRIAQRRQDCSITLWHRFTSRNPWVYHYSFQDDGSIAQTSSSRLNDPIHKLEKLQRVVAGSLEEFLAIACSPAQIQAGVSVWSPGPLLPVPGDKQVSKPKMAQPRYGNRTPDDVRAAIQKIIDLKILKNPFNFFHSSQPPTLEQIRSLEKDLGTTFPAEYVEFVRLYGAVRVEAKEDVWPRPRVGDVGPAWSFESAVAFFVTAA